MPKQQHHTAKFKSQVVLEMLKEEQTIAQIAAEHQIHPGRLHRWKRQALDNIHFVPNYLRHFLGILKEGQARKIRIPCLLFDLGLPSSLIDTAPSRGNVRRISYRSAVNS